MSPQFIYSRSGKKKEVFPVQTQSIDFGTGTIPGSDVFANLTNTALGFANVWSIGFWIKPEEPFVNFRRLLRIEPPSSNNNIIIFTLNTFAAEQRLFIEWADKGNSSVSLGTAAWGDFFTGQDGLWTHVLVVWTGTQMFALRNGVDNGAPNFGSATVFSPSTTLVMDDSIRHIDGVGGREGTSQSMSGLLAQAQFWRADVRSAATFLNTNPSSIDLNVDEGAYTYSGDLAHWYRLGHEASPNLGKDFSTAGFTPTIDLEVPDSTGITDGDRIADVPS